MPSIMAGSSTKSDAFTSSSIAIAWRHDAVAAWCFSSVGRMDDIDELLANNQSFAASVRLTHFDVRPTRRLAIVTCTDSRLDVFAALGLGAGEAHVLRNAGGVITVDMIRSLAVSQRRLGTRGVMLIQPTNCGMQSITDDGFRAELQDATGVAPAFAIESFSDLEANIRQSILRVRRSPTCCTRTWPAGSSTTSTAIGCGRLSWARMPRPRRLANSATREHRGATAHIASGAHPGGRSRSSQKRRPKDNRAPVATRTPRTPDRTRNRDPSASLFDICERLAAAGRRPAPRPHAGLAARRPGPSRTGAA